MSLNWSIEEIENWQEKCYVPAGDNEITLSKMTDAIIWATMQVDLNGITERNVDDWMRRIAVCQAFDKPFGTRFEIIDGERRHTDLYFTRKEIEDHIGLGTNVSTKTFTAWYRRMCSSMLEGVDYKLKREKEHDQNERS